MAMSAFELVTVNDMLGCLEVYDFFINDLEENRIYFGIGTHFIFTDQKD